MMPLISELGHFSFILALCLAFALSVIPLNGAFQNHTSWKQTAKSIAVGGFCFLLLSFICLKQVQSSLTSLMMTPLMWMWAFVLSGVTLAVALCAKQISTNKTVYVLSGLGIINTVFLFFVLSASNPFLSYVSPASFGGKNFNRPEITHKLVIGEHFPSFSLSSTADDTILITQNDLLGKVSLVNVWATWCVSCRVENTLLLKLATGNNIIVVGVNYKDNKNAAQKWLSELGNPYFFSIYDGDGKLGTDLGVSGAPETYVVDKRGIIRYKYVGVLSENVWQAKLKPEFDKWQQTK